MRVVNSMILNKYCTKIHTLFMIRKKNEGESMKRPTLICHMMQSINGKIAGNFYEAEMIPQGGALYRKLSEQFDADAILYGRITAEELFTAGNSPKLVAGKAQRPVYQGKKADRYIVVLDPHAKLAWNERSLNVPRLKDKGVITIVSEQADDSYLRGLETLGISYVVSNEMDKTLNVLYETFGIEKMLVQGGGIINASLIEQGVIDEISLVIIPVVALDQAQTCFIKTKGYSPKESLETFSQVHAQTFDKGIVWLHYEK